MTIKLTAVAFNHGFVAGPHYTLPLCFNERQPVGVPEWVRGGLPVSHAAYVRDLLTPEAAVLARFLISADEPPALEVCAKSSAHPPSLPTHGKLLPDLPPTIVLFNQVGDSGWCRFPLDLSEMAAGGVGVAVTQWTWYYRRAPGLNWTPFDQSVHKSYVVLSTPTAPWSVQPAFPFNPIWPWTEVLDLACEWAEGAQDVEQAAGLVTRAVNSLGPRRITYDSFAGAPHYTVFGGANRFLCEEFIERVRGGEGGGPLVNCSDCATIVSTFSNILGADLWQSKMGLVTPSFALNPILGIGADSWSTLWGGFTFHEVAWSGACTERDTIYDACLHTDADVDPTRAPHRPNLPINQVFGGIGTGDYRDQIAAPSGRDECVPQPHLRVRRSVAAQVTVFQPNPFPEVARRSAEERLRVSEVAEAFQSAPEASDQPQYFIEGFKFFGGELPGWSMTRLGQFTELTVSAAQPAATSSASAAAAASPGDQAAAPPLQNLQVHITWWRSPERPEALLRVETFDTPSAADARETLLRVANEVQCPLLEPWKDSGVGDIAFRTPDGVFVMFARGNHVHVVRSASTQPVDATKEAAALDQWLTGTGVALADGILPEAVQVPVVSNAAPSWIRFTLRSARAQREPGGLVLEPNPQTGGSVKAFVVEPTQAAEHPAMKDLDNN